MTEMLMESDGVTRTATSSLKALATSQTCQFRISTCPDGASIGYLQFFGCRPRSRREISPAHTQYLMELAKGNPPKWDDQRYKFQKSATLDMATHPTKNPKAFQLRDSLKINEKCSKEDSNLHRLPY
jgi:hypothetical protein